MQHSPTHIVKVIIDPRCRINYASYHIEGLRRLCGAVTFQCLPDITAEPSNGVAVRVVTDAGEKNVFFDCWDGDGINEQMYAWADAYGKVNLRPGDAARDKMVALGPNFGISLWNPLTTMLMAVRNYRAVKRAGGAAFKQPFKAFVRDYAYMIVRRKRYSYYYRFTREEQPGYFFSLSTLWWGDLSFNTTNKYRGDFMRLCKQHMDTFDGGFFYVDQAEQESAEYSRYQQEFADMLYKHRLPMSEYDKRIKAGKMSLMGEARFTKRDHMRYRFMMQLFGLRLDKRQWERDFGCSLAKGLPAEYAFFKASGAFDIDDAEQVTLSRKGKYLLVAMMRQFFVGVNTVRDRAREALPEGERALLFGDGAACEKVPDLEI